jgi:membrane protease YdiL (CAAX protease family)
MFRHPSKTPPKRMLFTVLWLSGMVGVLSTLWLDLPISEELPIPLTVVKLLNLISPTFLLSIAVLVGVTLADKVSLSAPLAEAISNNTLPKLAAIKPLIIPGLMGGAIGGIMLSAWFLFWRSALPIDFITKAEELSKNTPFLTRILYGGITEEIIMRWGLMTFLVWVIGLVLQKAEGTPHIGSVILAIVISSFVFGFGHLPIAFALSSQVTTSLVLYVVIGNSLFGLIAGYLYWHTGLEAAMIAHVLVHGVMAVADSLKS